MSRDLALHLAPYIFWAFIALEGFAVVVRLLALAMDLPPTVVRHGHGIRVLQVVVGTFAILVAWNFYYALMP